MDLKDFHKKQLEKGHTSKEVNDSLMALARRSISKKKEVAKKMKGNKGVLIAENRRHAHVRFGDPK